MWAYNPTTDYVLKPVGKNHAVLVAVIGTIGVIVAALIGNWHGCFGVGKARPAIYRLHIMSDDPRTHSRTPVGNAQVTILKPGGYPGALSDAQGLVVLTIDSHEPHVELQFMASCDDCDSLTLTRILDLVHGPTDETLLLRRHEPPVVHGTAAKATEEATSPVARTRCIAVASGLVVAAEDDVPLPNATIEEFGTLTRTYTDSTGHFELRLSSARPNCQGRLRAFLAGYEPWEQDTKLPARQLKIRLRQH